MDTLPRALGLVGAIALIALSGIILPRPARERLDASLGALGAPVRLGAEWVRLRVRAPKVVPAEEGLGTEVLAVRECLAWRRAALLSGCGEGEGAASVDCRARRVAVELATRERHASLGPFVGVGSTCGPDHLFGQAMVLGGGSRMGISAPAPVLTGDGQLVGVIESSGPLTSVMVPIGTRGLVLPCDILGREGAQGVVVGPWRRAGQGDTEAVAGAVELQVTGRLASPHLGDVVVSSCSLVSPFPGGVPGGLAVGRISALETTEEGCTRARVRLWCARVPETVYVMTSLSAGVSTPEADPRAELARCRAELRCLTALESDQLPRALRQVQRLGQAAQGREDVARIVFAVQGRTPVSFFDHVDPVSPLRLGLRPGLACLQHGALAGVLCREDRRGDLHLRLLTSRRLAVRVEVVQHNGVRYRGLVAAAEGRLGEERVPDDWHLPGQPRLQVVSLDHGGHRVRVPAEVVTAAGGELLLPPGIPVGRLVTPGDEPHGLPWEVIPYADFSFLDYCAALVPRSTLAGGGAAASAAGPTAAGSGGTIPPPQEAERRRREDG
ncbi:MAG: hypothetical protein JXR77_16060 [Lentisphaeria bacterium]|nr:hypothetical protein [Lentisphaeria bacterium]